MQDVNKQLFTESVEQEVSMNRELTEDEINMDYKNMLNIYKLIKSISNRDNIIFIVSHDREFLNCTANKILNLENFKK